MNTRTGPLCASRARTRRPARRWSGGARPRRSASTDERVALTSSSIGVSRARNRGACAFCGEDRIGVRTQDRLPPEAPARAALGGAVQQQHVTGREDQHVAHDAACVHVLALPLRVGPAQIDAGIPRSSPRAPRPSEFTTDVDVQNRLMRACPSSAQIERVGPVPATGDEGGQALQFDCSDC